MGFNSLSNRDLIALSIVIARTLAPESDGQTPDTMVAGAFALADAFVAQSHGHWAIAPDKRPRRRNSDR